MSGFGHPSGKFNACFHQILPRDVQRIEDYYRDAFGFRIQSCGHTFGGVGQNSRKLIHGYHVVIPSELVALRCGRSRSDVMKVSAHHQRPRIVQPLSRIRSRSQPFRGNRGLLRGICEQLLFAQPALLISLRRQ